MKEISDDIYKAHSVSVFYGSIISHTIRSNVLFDSMPLNQVLMTGLSGVTSTIRWARALTPPSMPQVIYSLLPTLVSFATCY
jgi:hypothetical protein